MRGLEQQQQQRQQQQRKPLGTPAWGGVAAAAAGADGRGLVPAATGTGR
jgi:hypothetical protein